LRGYIRKLAKFNISEMTKQDVQKKIDLYVCDADWNRIFKENINTAKGYPQWNFNFEGLHANMSKTAPDVAMWSQSYGLWPGRAWAMIAAHSPWVHLNTNTLPFYNVFPRLQGTFGTNDFNIIDTTNEDPSCHWLHRNSSEKDLFHLSNKMWRWLRYKDGAHVLLGDKTEAGWYYLADRGTDASVGTGQGEYTPEHVHHNYKYSRKSSLFIIS
jgi:hypothetical protein